MLGLSKLEKIKKILNVNLGTDFILLKFILFLLISTFGISSMLILNKFNIFFVFLLITTIWSCSRIYYFLFYVIHKFFDPQYKFSGLFHFISYIINRNRKKLYSASIEEASIAILRRRGYKIKTKNKTVRKIKGKRSNFWKRKSKLFWEEDMKK